MSDETMVLVKARDLLTAAQDIKGRDTNGEYYALPAILMTTDKVSSSSRPVSDSVNHPSHYNQGNIEVIEFIEDKKLDFHRGNAVKYLSRAGKKDPAKELEDLKKAQWYIARAIENFLAQKEARKPLRPNDMKPSIPREKR